ncbi:MAG: alpha-L-fucosidase, partial [Actinobacteria bacterium]|nr:alpha-L-fucosidase [Actinomycetota bacterium]
MDVFKRFEREVPEWFLDAKLGFMVSWGAFSVPAWGEPIGELGTIDDWKEWFKHNPYAEWYYNTIRIEGSPAREFHKKNFNDCDYDDLLDMWKAEKFQPDEWAKLFAYAGAQYIVPLSKHHDGITLWDAPGTGTRNTVHRGPKRDLIGDIATAVRKAGIRFAVYYSGGLDWEVTKTLPAISDNNQGNGGMQRPVDAAYSMYAYKHVIDLIDRYKPDVLWNDIEWPDFSKREGEYSLAALFDYYYKEVPHGVVNDRWGKETHFDYETSEYQFMADSENAPAWENCRGIGLSFGYNQVESEQHSLNTESALRHFLDIVSRGGNFLLNVGPTASGEIPEIQKKVLMGLGDWMAINSGAVYATRAIKEIPATDTPWVRWAKKGNSVFAYIDAVGNVEFSAPASLVNDKKATIFGGAAITATRNGDKISMTIPAPKVPGP